jgi:hypothetical protein
MADIDYYARQAEQWESNASEAEARVEALEDEVKRLTLEHQMIRQQIEVAFMEGYYAHIQVGLGDLKQEEQAARKADVVNRAMKRLGEALVNVRAS